MSKIIVSGGKKKTIIRVADVGNSGPAGAAGVSGGNYTHVQSAPSAAWTVTHNLGYFPGGVSVIDSAGTKVYGDITHSTVNQLVVIFSAGFSGKAYLS